MTRITIDDDPDPRFPFWIILLCIILAVVIYVAYAVAAVFGAFLLSGVAWGLFLSIRNYALAIGRDGKDFGGTIASAWNRNVESMKDYFDRVKYYDHILKPLVKCFLFMVAIGIISVGTLFMPVCIVLHGAVGLLLLPFKTKELGSALPPSAEGYVRDPRELPPDPASGSDV